MLAWLSSSGDWVSVLYLEHRPKVADAICDALGKLDSILDVDLRPLRAYKPATEVKAYTKAGQWKLGKLDGIEHEGSEPAMCRLHDHI